MARCEISGKGPVVKNLVSHSNIKTKSKAFANIQTKRLYSDALKEYTRFKIAVSALRDLEKQGNLDGYLLRQDDNRLSRRALTLKHRIQRKIRSKKASNKAPVKAQGGSL